MRLKIYYGWITALVFFIIAFAGWGTAQGTFGVFVNPLAENMRWSRTAISGAFSFNIGIGFLCGLFWGWLADRFTIQVVLIATGTILGLGVFLASTANTIWQFYLFYGLISGVGLGGISGPVSTLIARWFQGRSGMGLALGLGVSGIHSGVAVLPILSEYIISQNGWRSAFQVLSYIIWVSLFLGAILARSPKRSQIMKSVQHNTGGKYAPQDALPVNEGLTFGEACRTASFRYVFSMLVVGFLLVMMVVVHLVPTAIDHGHSSSKAAVLLTAVGVLSVVGSIVGGILVDKVGARKVYIGSMLVEMFAFVWLIYSSGIWMFYGFAMMFGIAHGAWGPQTATIIAKVFGTKHMGAIYGATLLGAGVGAIIGPVMAGLFFDLTGSYTVAFLICTFIASLGILLGILLSDSPNYPRLAIDKMN